MNFVVGQLEWTRAADGFGLENGLGRGLGGYARLAETFAARVNEVMLNKTV